MGAEFLLQSTFICQNRAANPRLLPCFSCSIDRNKGFATISGPIQQSGRTREGTVTFSQSHNEPASGKSALHDLLFPGTAANSRSSATSSRNWAGVSCWGPSESATGGLGCTSTTSESAPAATAAFASDGTRSRCPAGCDTSMHTGYSDCLWMTGTAAMSSVKRVAVSSCALAEHHVGVAVISDVVGGGEPLGDSAGEAALVQHHLVGVGRHLPIFFSRLKFWKLRAPTRRPST